MRTVKEVADLTGVSVRTLQYYDEIDVLKPTTVTEAGYRLYDDEALETLQQILFFKELDFQLKDIKEIMEAPDYDKIAAFKKQKQLLTVKRDRLNELLKLLDKLEKGETCMSFKEFDLSGYIQVLEDFKSENAEDVMKYWGSIDAFNDFIKKVKEDEHNLAELAVKQYGSVEKYTKAMKDSMSRFSENMEKAKELKEKGYAEKNKALTEKLVKDVDKDPESKEIQDIMREIIELGEEAGLGIDQGEHYWDMMIDWYLHNTSMIEAVDKVFGAGASVFMGKALQHYFQMNNG